MAWTVVKKGGPDLLFLELTVQRRRKALISCLWKNEIINHNECERKTKVAGMSAK
jgi:hypothetical protein